MGTPMEELGKGLKELKGIATPIGRTTVSTNWITQSSERLSHQPKSIRGVARILDTYVAEDGLM